MKTRVMTGRCLLATLDEAREKEVIRRAGKEDGKIKLVMKDREYIK